MSNFKISSIKEFSTSVVFFSWKVITYNTCFRRKTRVTPFFFLCGDSYNLQSKVSRDKGVRQYFEDLLVLRSIFFFVLYRIDFM